MAIVKAEPPKVQKKLGYTAADLLERRLSIPLGYDRWVNETEGPFKFKIYLGINERDVKRDDPDYDLWVKHCKPRVVNDEEMGTASFSAVDPFLYFQVDPGEIVEIPERWRHAIQTLDPISGNVIGGLCPKLTRLNEDGQPVRVTYDVAYLTPTEAKSGEKRRPERGAK